MLLTVLSMQSQDLKPVMSNLDTFLNEVFIGEGKIKPDSRQYQYFKELFENRLTYKKVDNKLLNKKEVQHISDVNLNTIFNSNLSRDNTFNINSFNPFKYNLNFYSKSLQIFKLENTDYVMLIYPQVIRSINRL